MSERFGERMLPGFESKEFREAVPPEPVGRKVMPEVVLASTETTAEEPTLLESPRPDASNIRGKRVWVIDSHSLIYQVFHAIPEMTSPRGEPVNAVYGFTRDLLFILEKKKPDYLLCAFDLPGKTFRHELYDRYKAGRPEMPEDLIPQIESIRQLLDAMGIAVLAQESYEADDILATIAHVCQEQQAECIVVTGDKDCRQLLSDRVTIYNVRKDEMFDAEMLKAVWGIRPDQVVDFQSLVGDSVDNVPGVELIGPKIARELLEKYDTLESVLDHASEISGKKRKQNLIDGRDQALLSRELVRLRQDVPITIDWDAGRAENVNNKRVHDLFAQFGFRSFVQRLDDLATSDQAEFWEADYRVVDTPEALDALVAQLAQQKRISIDTETTSVRPRQAEIVGYSVAWAEGEAYYIPVRAPEGQQHLDPDRTLSALRSVLENPSIEKIGQNLKYDMVVLRSAGVELAGVSFDTMVAAYLLDAGSRNHNLDHLAKQYLNHTTTKITDLIGTGKKQKRMDEVPVDRVAYYASEDADVPLRLAGLLFERLQKAELAELFESVEIPLIEVLAELEYNGILVDISRLEQLSLQYGQQMARLESEIYDLAGGEFNIASPKQLSSVLFDQLELPVIKKTKSGPSTDAEVLETLALEHDLPAKIVEYRQYAKLKNTYVDALPNLVHPETGRVHASFNQVVTATGRLSSSDPNLQNIPIRTETGREIRSAFLPGHDDWKLLAADYSQIELRVLAHFSGDEKMCEAFARDEDIHALVASQIHSVALDKVTATMRRSAKAVNFGVIYGQSPFGLAKSLGIQREEAAEFITAYFARYPQVEGFLEKILAECHEKGYVSTILGRQRGISGVRNNKLREARRQRNLPERTAINTVIQGSAADLIKLAMIEIHRRLRSESLAARMLVQIHDELVFEVPSVEFNHVTQLVTEVMGHILPLDVPLKVDVKSGRNWSECE